jgi:RHS repeat-associated protein
VVIRGVELGFVRAPSFAVRVVVVLFVFATVAATVGVGDGHANPTAYYANELLATPSLKAYWPLDETSGSTALDQTSSPANATYSSVTLNQAGAIQSSADSAVAVTSSSGIYILSGVSKVQATASWTLEVWFKTTSSSSSEQPLLESSGGNGGAKLYLASGKVWVSAIGTGGTGSVQSATSFNDGNWHYVVGTWSGSQLALYVDGALAAPASGSANPLAWAGTMSYGAIGPSIGYSSWNGTHFTGTIDEPAIYGSNSGSSGALNAGQIANHYATALTGPVASPVNVVPPSVSGNGALGSSVTVSDTGAWNSSSSYGALGFSYQWQRCAADGTSCASILGATGAGYTVTETDVGHALSVQVTATSTGGSESVTVALPEIGGYRWAVFNDGGANLRGYWPLDETAAYPNGQTAADISSSPAAGSYFAGVTLNQAGPINDQEDHAASFDGTGSSALLVPNVSKAHPTASFTLEVWFKTTSSSSAEQPLLESSGGNAGAKLYLASGKVWAGAANGGGWVLIQSASAFNDGQWHYAVETWNGTQLALYVDGVLATAASGSSNPLTWAGAPTYGALGPSIGYSSATSTHFTGLIDEPALYGSNSGSDGALSADEVATHYGIALYSTATFSGPVFGKATAGMTRGLWNAAMQGLCNCAEGGSPVYGTTGDYSITDTDALVPTFGPGLSFDRTYDSSLSSTGTPGPLGYGWTSNWSTSLSFNTPDTGDITVTEENGAQVIFYPPVAGKCQSQHPEGPGSANTYCARPDVTATLTYIPASSTYQLVLHPYRAYTYDSTGKLIGESTAGGASLSVSYNTPSPGSGSCPATASACNTVTSASGRTLVIARTSAGLITKVVAPLGRTWSYGYCSLPSTTCSSDDLVSVTDPLGHVTSFTYDKSNGNTALVHDLLSITEPNGQPGGPDAGAKTVNGYNSSGLLTSQTDPAGNQTSYDYANLNLTTGIGYTVRTDPDGNETKFAYKGGVLVSRTEGYSTGSPSTWTYNPNGQRLHTEKVVDPNGNTTVRSFDQSGNVITTTDPLGRLTTAAFNGFDEQTCATAPLAASGCAFLTLPSAITVGSSPIASPSAAPPKYVTYTEYDTAGDLIWATTGDYAPGASSASQSRTSYRLYNGQSVTLGSNTDSCAASAPASALPCATIDPNGVVTQLGYDSSSGDITSSSTPDGNAGGEVAQTTFGYDGYGELTTTTAPNGNLSGATAADFTTTNAYDSDGELTSTTIGHTGGGTTARATFYTYDDNGNRLTTTDPRLKVTHYAYDADDRLTLVTDPDGQNTLSCYDGDGHLAQTVPPVGVAANSLTPSSCPSTYPAGYGNRLATDATTYSYDALGNTTEITSPAPAGLSGHETTTNAYDPAGRLESVTAPAASNSVGAPSQVTAYTYDAAGQPATRTNGSGTAAASTTVYCYDPNGEKTAIVAPDGNTSSPATCSSSSPYGTSSAYQTAYAYDSLGEQVSKTTPSTSFATNPTWTYGYDPAGNALTAVDPKGVTTTNTYTPLNQLAGVTYSGSSAPTETYSYDANGNRLTMDDGTGTSTYAYDPFNELTSYENGAGKTVSYGYDDDGNTASVSYPLGAGATWATSSTITYGYDDASELNSVTDFNGHTITIGSTADGLPNSIALASTGDTITTAYDPTDQPSDIELANGSTLLGFSYSDVPSGAIESETDTPSWAGSPAAYTYDAQNRVTQMTPGAGSPLGYGFDASGNATPLPTGATGSYDNASELTSSTLAGTTTTDTYDADGERTQQTHGATTVMSASYDGAQRLTTYSNTSANMTAATYDGDGLRASTTITPTGGSAATQSFTWDPTPSIPRLLMDSTNAYIYAGANTPTEQVTLATGTTHYLVADQLGSVRGIVDSSGSLTASTAYDAWGNPETTSGLTAYTPLGFTGSYTDTTGLTYLIHRYYDPQTGQFLTVDPLVDETENAYAYASGDPVMGVDLNGLVPGRGCLSMKPSDRLGCRPPLFPGALTTDPSGDSQTLSSKSGEALGGLMILFNSKEGSGKSRLLSILSKLFGSGGGDAGGDLAVAAARKGGDHIVLGLRNQGLKELAEQVGGRTLLNLTGSAFRQAFYDALGDSNTTFTLSLDGLRGSTTAEQLDYAIARGARGFVGKNYTNAEIAALFNSGRLGATTLMRSGEVVANPYAGGI